MKMIKLSLLTATTGCYAILALLAWNRALANFSHGWATALFFQAVTLAMVVVVTSRFVNHRYIIAASLVVGVVAAAIVIGFFVAGSVMIGDPFTLGDVVTGALGIMTIAYVTSWWMAAVSEEMFG